MKKILCLVTLLMSMFIASICSADINIRTVHLFLDCDEGYSILQQSELDRYATQLQKILPTGCTLVADVKLAQKIDALREEKLDRIFTVKDEDYDLGEPTLSRVLLNDEDWGKICEGTDVKHVLHVRFQKGFQKVKTNTLKSLAGLGGTRVKTSINVITKLFNVGKGKITFQDKQTVEGQSHSDFTLSGAAKMTLDKVCKNVQVIPGAF